MTPQAHPRHRGAFSPIAAFAALFVLIVAGFGYLATRDSTIDPSGLPDETPTSQTDHQLTDDQAVSRFKELDAARQRAYATADPDLASTVFAAGRRTYEIVRRELSTLEADRVTSESIFKTRSLEVVENGPRQIRLRQIVVVSPKFVDARGRDVTGHASPKKQTIEWTLVWTGDQWLIGDSRVLREVEAL